VVKDPPAQPVRKRAPAKKITGDLPTTLLLMVIVTSPFS
jgi:hypothetical protein